MAQFISVHQLNTEEKAGRDKVVQYFNLIGIDKFGFPKERYSPFDVKYITNKGNKCLGEIKMRGNDKQGIPYEYRNDMLIEKIKMYNVINIAAENDWIPTYVNVYLNSNTIRFANLNDYALTNINWIWMKMPECTFKDNDEVEINYVMKEVSYIPSHMYYQTSIK